MRSEFEEPIFHAIIYQELYLNGKKETSLEITPLSGTKLHKSGILKKDSKVAS
jgi:hypothetical protein